MARLAVIAASLLGLLAAAFALRLPVVRGQAANMPAGGGWKPTDAAATRYIGRAVCAECHQAQSASHPHTGMAGAAQTIEDCDVLRERPLLTFATGPYRYRIERKGKRSVFTVT